MPGGWKEEQFSKVEDYVCLESDLAVITVEDLICFGYRRGK
jgi:hypothetical protein